MPGIQPGAVGLGFFFSLKRVSGGIFPPGCGAWIPPGHAPNPNPIPEPAARSKAQFPESFRPCGDSRKRLLPALDPSPSRREKLRPGLPRVNNGIGDFNRDKLKAAQHSQTASFLLFPRNPLGEVGIAVFPQGDSIPLSRSLELTSSFRIPGFSFPCYSSAAALRAGIQGKHGKSGWILGKTWQKEFFALVFLACTDLCRGSGPLSRSAFLGIRCQSGISAGPLPGMEIKK